MGDIEDVGDAVADELTFDPDVDASGVTVRIVDGELTLAGTVPSYPQYLAATADARRIAGDRNVRNGLEVRLPPGDVRDELLVEPGVGAGRGGVAGRRAHRGPPGDERHRGPGRRGRALGHQSQRPRCMSEARCACSARTTGLCWN